MSQTNLRHSVFLRGALIRILARSCGATCRPRQPNAVAGSSLATGALTAVVVCAAIAFPSPARCDEALEGLGGVRVVRSQMIWDAAPHNAFTDLICWKGRWYCSFREADSHSSYDGAARILSSEDGRTWRSAARFDEAGRDVRDPKLCILPDGRLLLGVGSRRQDQQHPDRWHTQSRVYITGDGETWEGPYTVGDPQVWMWRYVTQGEYVYSFGYHQANPKAAAPAEAFEHFLQFYRSRDGMNWETITQSKAGGGYVNEAAFAFEPDQRCVVLLRREGGNGRLGLAAPPYTDWTWTDLDERFNGPALLRLPDGRLLAAGRSKALGASSAMTALGWLTTDPPALRPLLWLPSRHETGYPGLFFEEGRVWASYYSSQSGKCAIYIAELEIVSPDQKPDLLHVVRSSAEALLEHGRDRWRSEPSDMIISILDRQTLEAVTSLPRPPAGVRDSDRANEYGSNANLQQNLYQVLFLLSEITGEAKYRDAATGALVDFVRLTQSSETGLFGWGEHIFYDLKQGRVTSPQVGDRQIPMHHEMKKPLLFWDFLYAREPQRLQTFARGLWEHQIYDQQTGDFSRHARWNEHRPGQGYDFTKEGGYMIDVWSRMYAATGEEVSRTAVETLAGRYLGKLNERKLLDYDSVRPNYCNNGHNVTLASECHDAAMRFGDPRSDPTARLLLKLAEGIDAGFLGVEHAVDQPERGFIVASMTDSGDPRDRDGPGPGGYSVLWGMGYGRQTTAMVGLHCYRRMRQLSEGPDHLAYRQLFLQAADRYLTEELPDKEVDLWPVEPGLAIQLAVAAYRETGKEKYLAAAERLARASVELFWDETSPLPRASSRSRHYEAITGPDTLLLALLMVFVERQKLNVPVEISHIDR